LGKQSRHAPHQKIVSFCEEVPASAFGRKVPQALRRDLVSEQNFRRQRNQLLGDEV
jgi:hypothetical protein